MICDCKIVTISSLKLFYVTNNLFLKTDFEPVLTTFVYLLSKNHNLEMWTAYQVRRLVSQRTHNYIYLEWSFNNLLKFA